MKTVEIKTNEEDTGLRIDIFIAGIMEELSRNNVQKMIESGLVYVNGKPVKSNYKIRIGDTIRFDLEEPKDIEIKPENIPLSILYEDKSIIVVDKPQGMVVHPAAGHYEGTLVNALLYHCKGELSGINGKIRPGIVHRIDKDTSGVLVAAKNNASHNNLSGQLKEHNINRIYNAVVFNNIKENDITIHAMIGRSEKDRKKMCVTKKNGRDAITHIHVLERFGKYTWIEAKLETGRTHQIRVHMSHIGNPLLGDMVYGPQKQPFSLSGQVLHAKLLGFTHPESGEYMEFCAPLPSYFEKVLNMLYCASFSSTS